MDTSELRDPVVGTTIEGRYEVMSRLGEGGMGCVYKARHLTMDRLVALKLIHRHLVDSDAVIKRFYREMKATSLVEHPSTIRVYDFGATEDGQLYLAVEFLDGTALSEVIRREAPLPAERVVHIARQVAEALHAAHSEGLVHRDLKPDNVMLIERYGAEDVVKVLDFGIARFMEEEGAQLTGEGAVIGTPAYMSPEQARGRDVDGRTDLYALGVMMYEMLTGGALFRATSPTGLLLAHVQQTPEPPGQRLESPPPPGLEGLILELLQKAPEARPSSATALVERLDGCLEGPAEASPEQPTGANPSGFEATERWAQVAEPSEGAAPTPRPIESDPLSEPGLDVASRPDFVPTSPKVALDVPAGRRMSWGLPVGLVMLVLAIIAFTSLGQPPESEEEPAPSAAQTPAAGSEAAEAQPASARPPAAPTQPPEPPQPEPSAVRAALDALISVDGDPPAPEACRARDVAALGSLTTAATLLQAGRPGGARAQDHQAARLLTSAGFDGAERQALLARARLFAGEGDVAAPAAAAVEACPSWALAHNLLGNAHQQVARLPEARRAYEEASRLAPEYLAPRFNLGLVALAASDTRAALSAFEGIARQAPDHPNIHLALGQARLTAGDRGGAVAALEEATRRAPDDPRPRSLLEKLKEAP